MFVLAAAFIAGIGFVAFQKSQKDADLGSDYCSTSKPPSTIIALAIDASDPFDAVQGIAVDNKIRDAVGTLSKGDRLDIFEVNAAKGGLATRTFSMCNPGDPTAMDKIYTNENDEESNYKKKFESSLAHALKAAEGQPSDQSPILESLRSIAPISFPPESKGSHKRLVVISDLIQNTPTYSMFKSGSADFNTFKMSPQYANAEADFSGVDFDLLVIMRAIYAKEQTLSLIHWWEAYISDNDGRLVGYKRI